MNNLDASFWNKLEKENYWPANHRDIHIKATGGCTALMWTTIMCSSDMVESLIEAGSDVHTLDEKGRSCLHAATNSNRPDLVKRFIELQVNPFILDNQGKTALDLFEAGYSDKIIFSLLTDWMSQWNARELHQTLPLSSKFPRHQKI